MNWYDVITDQYIKNAAIGYYQEAPLEVFNIFPKVNVRKFEGLIPKYVKGDWFKIGSVDLYKRFGSSESIGDDFATDKQSYRLHQYSFHKDVTKLDVEQTEDPYQAVNDAVKFVIGRLNRVTLKVLAAEFLATGKWSNEKNETTAANRWDNKTSGTSNADPVEQVIAYKQAVEKTTGFVPNKMMITPDVYAALMNNTKIIARIATTQTRIVSTQLLASLFDMDEFVVFNAVNETPDDYFESKKVLLAYTPKGTIGNKFEPSAGYIMTYQFGDSYNLTTNRIPMPMRNNSVRIETDMYIQPVIPAADCGYLIRNIVA
jgi:hypothetical protein